ncbi:MAG TPA: hypothetical protein VFY79_01260 [Dehalococcoidia bacterium]|nr:hypothetical protein [Dehalococcoidia bacterium]
MIATTHPMARLADEVEAHFASLESATEAVGALELAGIKAAELSVAGATDTTRDSAGTSAGDASVAGRIAVRATVGAVLGGMLGAAIGAIAGEAIVLQSGGVNGYGGGVIVGLGALVTAIVCFVIGAFIGGESALPMSEQPEPARQALAAPLAIVHVRVADAAAELRAEAILLQRHPIALHRIVRGRHLIAA